MDRRVFKRQSNDVVVRASRASVRRKLGDYAGALDDYSQIGEKFQLYAINDSKVPNGAKSVKEGTNEITVNKYDLLTITKIEGEHCYVSEVNNDLTKCGWINGERAGWSLIVNGQNFATATPTQNVQTIGRNIIPTPLSLPSPFPFVGSLDF